jgi:hypothetical protein
MRRFAKFTYHALARCCSRVLLESEVLICAGLISFAAYWPATGQQNSVSSSYVFGSGDDFRAWFRALVSFLRVEQPTPRLGATLFQRHIWELIGSVNTGAFVGTNPTNELITSELPRHQPTIGGRWL